MGIPKAEWSERLGFSELTGLMSVCSTRHFLGPGTLLTEELLTLRMS